MRGTFIVFALATCLHACAARTVPPAASQSSAQQLDPRELLRRDLAALFGTPALEHALCAVSVYSLRANESLFSVNGSRLVVPASNQKVLTTAVAAERLGWNHRFSTRIFATGPISNGTLEGDLIIVGNGDPTINPRHAQRWRAFDDWAAALSAKGVKKVSGSIIGDDNAFEEPGWGMGWSWDDLPYGFGAPIGALQYNENQVDVLVAPGREPGLPAIIGTSPPGSGLDVVNQIKTAVAGTDTRVTIARIPGGSLLTIRGEIAVDANATWVTAAVDDPTRLYLNAFRDALKRHGIVVGGVLDIDELRESPRIESALELIVDHSSPLSEIVDVANKWSRNGYAETLLLAMSPPEAPASDEKSLDSLRQTLTAWGIAPESYLPRDGSGLSRYNYVTTDAIAALLITLAKNPVHADLYRSTLPVAGQSGTLANRMKGTPAEMRVFAKTGSMSNVRAISGYLMTLADEPLVFSIVVNNYRLPAAEIDALIDKALIRLVEFRR